ncbi:DUF1667 domain-containing protein [Treponema phagedenis]|uniref:DUF1667 domain-containing protein n=1 Tax=Treponema phagedenis TaxID=162 RepID=A0A0B7GXR5_TREPH|nr:DUF1667 domain-containing protein [Treponema phagedenis]EFW37791.1 hypothetical protein HMPREF9554_01706 [Treponema phagedenis F0421]NVP25192.1 DUF1667 domain-containing protein [Treponema phagedenis]QEJ95947.1 DUF1667 domain-containing protein [Treponema phagedenis]QEJ97309.1 DUF1667 domain-containing protein [Treponema phagedenis]QEK00354.1 DUF1667 domain-containing protein [Treponema phagedenis]
MKEFICVSCPIGCRLTVTEKNGEYIVTGNSCKRGLEYGLQEMTDPRRNISSTVRISNSKIPMLPVKTAAPIPKGKIFEVMTEINKTSVSAPVTMGDVIIQNVLGTGIDIVASRSIDKK